jgi:fibronectin-binding autotransporter adhesin
MPTPSPPRPSASPPKGASNHGGTSTLRLGQTNILNSNTINIGASSRSNATLNFRDGLSGTPTVKIRGTNGTSAVTTWDVGRVAATGNSAAWTSTVDLSAGELDALVTSLRIGRADTGGSANRSGTVNAFFTMGKGTLEVGTLIVGEYTGSGSVGTGHTYAGNGTFTLDDASGLVKAATIILADNTGTATGGNARTTSGTFNLTAGTLEAASIDYGTNTGNATATTRNFNFTSGTLRNLAGNDLTISNVPLNLTGTGTRIFEATTERTITVASTADISGSGQGFTKAGDGTLILQGTKSYTGATLINTGTLEVQGSIASSSSITNDAALVFNSGSAQSYGNGISGSGTLTKSGGGTLTLTGTNTYTGATTLSAGTLILNNATALGGNNPGVNGTSSISMAAGTTLRSNYLGAGSGNVDSYVYAPITLTGTGTATFMIGAGTSTAPSPAVTFNLNGAIGGTAGTNVVFTPLTTSLNNADSIFVLGAASTYDGNTTISGGQASNRINVMAGVANALPETSVLSFDNVVGIGSGRISQFDFNGNDQTLAGLSNGGSVPNLRNHRVTNTGDLATLTINNSADYTFGGSTLNSGYTTRAQITGKIGLVKSGAGTFTLGGTLAGGATAGGNTFTGATKILGGILSLGETLSLQNSPLDTAGSVTGDTSNGLRTTVTTLRLGGLTGDKNFADVFTSSSGGYSGLTALTLNPGMDATHSYSGDTGDGTGGMTLTKIGAGTQVLTATNTHSGATTVAAGVLALAATGSIASSEAITVAAGATLDVSALAGWTLTASQTLAGNGSVVGAAAIAGTLAPGASIGTLAFSSGVTFASSSSFAAEIDTTAALSDRITLGGPLAIAAGSTLDLSDTGANDAIAIGAKLTLIDYTGHAWNGGIFTYLGSPLPDLATFAAFNNQWQVRYEDNTDGSNPGAFLTLTAIPEPAATLFLPLACALLFRRRR